MTIKTVTKLTAVPTTQSLLQQLFIDACSCSCSSLVMHVVIRAIQYSVGYWTADCMVGGWSGS
jgi:hypothetical protein